MFGIQSCQILVHYRTPGTSMNITIFEEYENNSVRIFNMIEYLTLLESILQCTKGFTKDIFGHTTRPNAYSIDNNYYKGDKMITWINIFKNLLRKINDRKNGYQNSTNHV